VLIVGPNKRNQLLRIRKESLILRIPPNNRILKGILQEIQTRALRLTLRTIKSKKKIRIKKRKIRISEKE
jgi:hypothetical protein